VKIIKINNKDYIIKYSINQLIAMEKATGKPFTALFGEGDDISLEALRTLIYYGLKDGMKELTHEQTGDIIADAIEGGISFLELAKEFTVEMGKSLGFKKEDMSFEGEETDIKNV